VTRASILKRIAILGFSLGGTRNCPFALVTPRSGRVLLVAGHEIPFDDGSWEACIRDSISYVMGYNEAVRGQSTAAAIAFLKRPLMR